MNLVAATSAGQPRPSLTQRSVDGAPLPGGPAALGWPPQSRPPLPTATSDLPSPARPSPPSLPWQAVKPSRDVSRAAHDRDFTKHQSTLAALARRAAGKGKALRHKAAGKAAGKAATQPALVVVAPEQAVVAAVAAGQPAAAVEAEEAVAVEAADQPAAAVEVVAVEAAAQRAAVAARAGA